MHMYIRAYVCMCFGRGVSTRGFVFFFCVRGIYLIVLFMHMPVFPACCFHQAACVGRGVVVGGGSVGLELAPVCSLGGFQLAIDCKHE